jgi:hypothetical protein
MLTPNVVYIKESYCIAILRAALRFLVPLSSRLSAGSGDFSVFAQNLRIRILMPDAAAAGKPGYKWKNTND